MFLDALDDGAKRLVLVLCLPLVDGVFATLLVTGAVGTFSDVVAVALTIFAGAGSLAVLYSHAETVKEARRMVLQAAPILVTGALLVALVAPVFEQLFHVTRLRYAAGMALLVIAGQLLDLDLADRFTVPAIIVTGFALSVQNPAALHLSTAYLLPAGITALVAVFALLAAASVDQDRFSLGEIRLGGALVLGLIALSQFGMNVPAEVGLGVLALAIAASAR